MDVLWGVTLIDGTGAAPRHGAVVAVKGGRIVYVGDTADVQYRIGSGVRMMAAGAGRRWVVPGYVDVRAQPPEGTAATRFLTVAAAFGVTTLRAPAGARVDLRAGGDSGVRFGPRVVVGARPHNPGDPGPGVPPGDVRASVRAASRGGVDWFELGPGTPPALVAAGAEEAHHLRLRVAEHLGGAPWDDAVARGVHALGPAWGAGLARSVVPARHAAAFRAGALPDGRLAPGLVGRWRAVADPDGPEVRRLADRLRAARVAVYPNLVQGEAAAWGDDPAALERLQPDYAGRALAARWRAGRHPAAGLWSAEQLDEAKRAWPAALRLVRALHARGVLLAAASDAGEPWMTPGVAFHRELQLLAAAGIPPLEVLRIATRNGAEALGILAETGTVEVGKRADLVVLSGDPLADLANARRALRVYVGGKAWESPGDDGP